MKTNGGKESAYFGWWIGARKGEKLLTHAGGQQGTSTYLLMVPGKGFALALLANTARFNVDEVAPQLTDILLP
jgi:CubicO group peptidase (beta-lactamase class C family)